MTDDPKSATPSAKAPARWEVQRTTDDDWTIVTEEEAKRFASQGRIVRALYPAPKTRSEGSSE